MDDNVVRLIHKLKHADFAGRDEVVQALVETGAPAVLPLIEALKDKSFILRVRAARTLGKIGDPRAVLPLIEILKNYELDVTSTAVEALGDIALRNPVSELRAALPLLAKMEIYQDAIQQIEEATAAWKDLPLPAEPPLPATENLPLPAYAAIPEPDSLPIPTIPEEELNAGRVTPPEPGWRQRLRQALWRKP